MGNLRSVSKALEHLNAKVKISQTAAEIENADKLVLPGVGAFGDAMAELKRQGLVEPIRNFIAKKKFFLGICLGLQLLFKKSEESPDAEGLDVFKGTVRAFRSKTVKIPHMGWNQVGLRASSLLKGLPENPSFYFVHSFYAVPEDAKLTIGACEYGGENFTAILGNETAFATQFHPEKSQQAGLAILKNFISL